MADSTNMVPNPDGDDISYMTLSVDGPDEGVDPNNNSIVDRHDGGVGCRKARNYPLSLEACGLQLSV